MERLSVPIMPASFRFQCVVADSGALEDCIAADDGGTADAAEYRGRLNSPWPGAATPQGAAFARLRFWRLPPRAAKPDAALATVLVDEAVSPNDVRAPVAAADPLPAGEIVMAAATDAGEVYYPPSALRAGVQARVSVPCRVLTDRSLLCGHAQVDTGNANHSFDAVFERATRGALAARHAEPQLKSGGDSAERVGLFTMVWRIPQD